MPHFINQSQIPEKVRQPYLARYKARLRDALTNPALSNEGRQRIKRLLAEAGGAKTYRADSPMPPGAIDPRTQQPPGTNLQAALSASALTRLRKADLLSLAQAEGVGVSESQTKAEIVEAIMVARGNS